MKYLGIDFGLKRLGLAISEGNLAAPLKIIKVKGFKDALEKVKELIKAEGFDKIVVGLPEGKMGKQVYRFVKALKKEGLDVVETDETLSSQKALRQMLAQNISKKNRRVSDAVAAAIILQDYLDNQ